ncbi:GNAT family N-acetyltransferase [Sphingobium sp. AR-3-1]|uniref:GNAT family N-acetyltransferase n=1 Tax=Sphingobium psychrophilum TaxID=2728834 RepID=A0A7X9WVY7_9SPHN|nr:arsenic resistance N-acetyltransferase ArsN2 [Sphingobium psychrophilum]NML10588.1 GNAT family N-acetyltransferase [Sphingobium psychrophilum]
MITAIPVIDALTEALSAANLPIGDLAEPGRSFYQMGDDDGGTIGFGGLEGEGAHRLMRSLVLLPHRRGSGYGQALVAMLEDRARMEGVAHLHLLTTTAAAFFAAQGYQTADRASAPASIAASQEFTSLCPASASYMTRAIA